MSEPAIGFTFDRDCKRRSIVLVAHDHRKDDLVAWARHNREFLAEHRLFATASTGRLIRTEIGLPVSMFLSGPLGGDQQVGACIAQGMVDFLVFFWDPLEPQPHDPDVRALLRLATLWNIAVASNRTTADLIVTSPLFPPSSGYAAIRPEPSASPIRAGSGS